MKPVRFLLVLLAAVCTADAAFASGGDLSSLKVTVEKVYLKNTAGDWVLAAEPKTTADIAVEGPVVSVKNDGRIPAGEYVNVKLVLSETVRLTGNDGQNRTKAGGKIVIGGSPSKASDIRNLAVSRLEQPSSTWTTEGEPGEIEQTLDFDFEDRDGVMEIYGRKNFRKTLKVTEKSAIDVLLGLELRGVVRFAWPNYFSGIASSEAVYWLPSGEVKELTLKIDSSSAILTLDEVEWLF